MSYELPTSIDRRVDRYARKADRARAVVRELLHHRMAVIGFVLLGVYLFVAIIGPMLVTKDPSQMHVEERFESPSMEHPFGTDQYGRDVLTRVVLGAQTSLKVGVLVVSFAITAGTIIGLVAGYFRGLVDEILMRITDVMFAFPSLIMALLVIAILGTGLNKAILALGISFTPPIARVVRGNALKEAETEYVLAATAYGEKTRNIIFRDILPNIFSVVIVQAALYFSISILAEAGLSYIGLSAQTPTITWGLLISEGQANIERAPWVSFFPGLSIMVTVLGLTFMSVGVRDVLDPKSESVSEKVQGGL